MKKYAIILILTFIGAACGSQPKKVPLSERFKNRDFVTALPQLKPLEGKDGMKIGVRAKDCKVCHTEIYNEWKMTTHATALQDIQYQAELAKESSPRWLCLNCHIPVQNQREYFIQNNTEIIDKKDDIRSLVKVSNPGFDSEMQEESITCAVCHIRNDEKGNSYVIGSHGSTNAPHPVQQDKKYLRNICLRCHSPGGEHLTSTFLCWFKTDEELQAGPYAGKKICIDCHMPVKKRKLVPFDQSLPVRDSHQHHWVGSGVPKWFKDYDTLLERGYERSLEVKVSDIKESKGEVALKVHYKNAKAAHWLPTGDPERFILLRASLHNKSGKEIVHKKLRIGQEWDWGDMKTGRMAKKLHDNRLKPLEEREWDLKIAVSQDQQVAKVVVNALHVRLTSGTAKYMMSTKGINEKFLPNGQELVKNAHIHYPFASFVFREEIMLKGKKRKAYSMKELIELSKKEKGKSLSERMY